MVSSVWLVIPIFIAVLITGYLYEEKGFNIKPNNWIGPARKGSWTNIADPRVSRSVVAYLALPIMLMCMAGAISGKTTASSSYYLAFYLFWVVTWVAEYFNKKKSPFAVLDAIGEGGIKMEGLILGGLTGLAFYTLDMFGNFMTVSSSLTAAGLGTVGLAVIALNTSISIPLAEEGFFRGTWMTTIAERFGILVGLSMTAVLFGVSHLVLPLYSAELSVFLFSTFFGIFVGLEAFTFKSLIPPMMAHGVFNFLKLYGSIPKNVFILTGIGLALFILIGYSLHRSEMVER